MKSFMQFCIGILCIALTVMVFQHCYYVETRVDYKSGIVETFFDVLDSDDFVTNSDIETLVDMYSYLSSVYD